MTSAARYRKVIKSAKRIGSGSKTGNPRWEVEFTDGTVYRTKPDAAVGHEIENILSSGQPHWFTITYNRHISHAEICTDVVASEKTPEPVQS